MSKKTFFSIALSKRPGPILTPCLERKQMCKIFLKKSLHNLTQVCCTNSDSKNIFVGLFPAFFPICFWPQKNILFDFLVFFFPIFFMLQNNILYDFLVLFFPNFFSLKKIFCLTFSCFFFTMNLTVKIFRIFLQWIWL